MKPKLIAVALTSFILCACTPASVEYPHLAKILSVRPDIAELGIKEISGGMTLEGYGYTLDSAFCPGEFRVASIHTFDFSAKLDGAGKWSVVASEDLKNSLRKEDTTTAFNLMLDSLSRQCSIEHKRIQSWTAG